MATLQQLTELREIYRKLYKESTSDFVRGELIRVGKKLNMQIEELQNRPATTVASATDETKAEGPDNKPALTAEEAERILNE